MNQLEKKMVETLIDLKENHHVLGIKAEFEAEGTRLEEALRLKEVVTKAGLDLTIKIGGCEAIKDMYDARTIGVSKFKLTLQFALEILIVSVVMLGIGAVCGSFLAKPVGNMLLENEIQSVQEETEQISNNFGKGGPMDMNFGGTVNVQTIDTINAVVDITVVAQLLGIGLALMLVSSLASMISIQRFSPLTILKERS